MGKYSIKMAAPVVETPTVNFTLDDSEILRLKKLRNRLQLSHWSDIKREYELHPDESVAKNLRDLLTTDPVTYDVKYSIWDKRYSDFVTEWRKKKNPDTGEIEGHLLAVGIPRIENLGEISKGSIFYIMHGSMKGQALPTVKVSDVRLNHLQLKINFTTAKTFRNKPQSYDFMVGHDNALYGLLERNQLKKAFKEKKQDQLKPVTEKLADLLTNLNIVIKAANNGGKKPDTDQGEDEESNNKQATPHSLYQFNGGRDDEEDEVWHGHQAHSTSHPSYLKRFETTKDREAALRLAKKFTAPAPIFTEENMCATDGLHKSHSMGSDELGVSPKGDDASQAQVRHHHPHSLPPASPLHTELSQPLTRTLRSGNEYPRGITKTINKRAALLKKSNDKISKEFFNNGSTSA